MLSQERQAAREVTRAWWVFLVTGILWLWVSLIVLRFNIRSVAAVGVLLGVLFLMVAVNEFVIAGLVASWRWFHILLGIVFVIGAIWAFVEPIGAFYELAAILGFLLLLKGSFDIITAAMTKEDNDLWWLGLTVGILELILAFWVSQQYFAPRAILILIWVGFMAMFRGITEIVLAFQLRKVHKDLATA
jgi:uncharacterized membrane protein HdeD (DUF308 family)